MANVLTWEELTKLVSTLDETQAKAYLNYEISTGKRKSFITRLHQRYAKLRDKREREAAINGKLV